MPNIDDQLKDRLRGSAPRPFRTDDLIAGLSARKRRRELGRKAGTIALIVCVLLGTVGGVMVLNRVFRSTAMPVATPSQPVENLGFDFPICRVMSMPITLAGTPQTAYVVSDATGGCPAPGEGHRFLGVDIDGDGAIDANVELHGCYPPVGCEAFAAPDVNGDGTSEIATSEAGADGYGISLFEVIAPAPWASLPSVLPIDVVDRNDIGNLQPGPLQFAWVDVAGHTEGARCDASSSGTRFTIYDYEKTGTETEVRTTTVSIDGTSAIATVTDASSERVAVDEAPTPKNDLCGSPLYGSATNFPNAAD